MNLRPICYICGRRTTPFTWLNREPIGPKCAQRAGLTPAKAPKAGRVKFARVKPVRDDSPRTGDLFEGME